MDNTEYDSLDRLDPCPRCGSGLFAWIVNRPAEVLDEYGMVTLGTEYTQVGVWCPGCEWNHRWSGGRERVVPHD